MHAINKYIFFASSYSLISNMWPFLFPVSSLKSRHRLWKATGTDKSFLGGE